MIEVARSEETIDLRRPPLNSKPDRSTPGRCPEVRPTTPSGSSPSKCFDKNPYRAEFYEFCIPRIHYEFCNPWQAKFRSAGESEWLPRLSRSAAIRRGCSCSKTRSISCYLDQGRGFRYFAGRNAILTERFVALAISAGGGDTVFTPRLQAPLYEKLRWNSRRDLGRIR